MNYLSNITSVFFLVINVHLHSLIIEDELFFSSRELSLNIHKMMEKIKKISNFLSFLHENNFCIFESIQNIFDRDKVEL